MYRDAGYHQGDADEVLGGRKLAQHDGADAGGEHRQQRQHERERGPGQPRHRQLVGDVGDHRGAHPHPGARQQQRGVPERGKRAAQSPRCRRDRGDQHRRAEPVDPVGPAGRAGGLGDRIGDLVAEDDVQHEQRAVGEGEGETERLTGDADRGDGDDARRGEREGSGVTPGPRPGGGQDHGPDELDRAHRRQREPGHREVESRVHDGEHDAQGQQALGGSAIPTQGPPRQPPGPPPDGEHRGGRGNAQPGDSQHVKPGEQQHRQGGAKVMEDGADQEQRLRWQPVEPAVPRALMAGGAIGQQDGRGLRFARHRRSI
jgi:hypothetical protein